MESYHVPHRPKAAGLIERWNMLLKTQLQVVAAWWVLQKAVNALYQCPVSVYWTVCVYKLGTVSPIARIPGSRNQGVG